MKKLLFVFIQMFLPLMASAHDAFIDGIYYNLNQSERTAEVAPNHFSNNSYSGVIEIPGEITYNDITYKVNRIGSYAFYKCTDLTEVTIPENVTSIEKNSFSFCSSLSSVVIPNSVKRIEDTSFGYCTSLASFKFGDNVSKIGARTFLGCQSLTTITIPNSITIIEDQAFEDCTNLASVHITDLESWCKISFGDIYANPLYYAHHLLLNEIEIKDLVIPNSITNIGRCSFSGCSNLISVTIHNNISSIGDCAFLGCTGLTSVTIPNGVTSIDNSVFSGCTNLTSVTIPNSVTNIGACAFAECTNLPSIELPSSVSNIGACAFLRCSSLASITMSNSITAIGAGAFEECTNLTSFTIPNSVTSIGSDAFTDTGWYNSQPDGLLYIDQCLLGFKGDKPSGAVEVMDGTRVMADHSFYSCDHLNSIIIPNSVVNIGGWTFHDCKGLADILCYAKAVPNAADSTFQNYIYENTILHVPAASVKAYKSTVPWSGFRKVTTLPEGVNSGDANGDITINAADIVEVVNAIMGSPSENFNEQAADVNADGIVNAADIVEIIKIIMNNGNEDDNPSATLGVTFGSCSRAELAYPWPFR